MLELLESGDVEVVGTAADGVQAVESIRALKPDVVFLDVQMPRFAGGGSMNGKWSTSPSRQAVSRRITPAKLVREISGSVNCGRSAKSCSENSRTQTPGAMRPQRPARWIALACAIGSTPKPCTRCRVE